MKGLKLIITVAVSFAVLYVFSPAVFADTDTYISEQTEVSGIENVSDGISEESKELIDKFGIKPDAGTLAGIDSNSVLSGVFDIVLDRGKTPLKCGLSVVALLLVANLIKIISVGESGQTVADYVITAAITAIIGVPAANMVALTVRTVKDISTFSVAFIPVFCGILAASGKITAVSSISATLLGAAEVILQVCGNILAPAIGMYMAVGICGSLSGNVKFAPVIKAVKNVQIWLFTFISTVFLGIIGCQNVIGQATDTLSAKTVKFIVSSAIPIAGNVIGESLLTVQNSITLVGKTAGIYGIIAMSAIILPIVVEIILWRLVILVSSFVSDTVSDAKYSEVFSSVDSAFSIMLGVVLFVGIVFIISTAILAGVK